jgi:acetyl esterase/lipase
VPVQPSAATPSAGPPAVSLAERFPRLDRELAQLLDQARAAGQPGLAELDPSAARARVTAGDVLCSAGPSSVSGADIQLAAGLDGRLYQPERSGSGSIIVWFHGGGWVTGDLGYSDEICRLIAQSSRCPVLSVDYRLAPEHPFPAAVEDALSAVRWAARQGRGQVVVAGDSAGGNLAAVAASELGREPGVRLAGQLLVYPVLDTDLTRPSYAANGPVLLNAEDMKWFLRHYCPDPVQLWSPRVAPLRGPDLAGLPRTVIILAGHDPLVDEGLAYAAALRTAGVPVTVRTFESLPHGFLRFTGPVAAARAAAAEVATEATGLAGQAAAG